MSSIDVEAVDEVEEASAEPEDVAGNPNDGTGDGDIEVQVEPAVEITPETPEYVLYGGKGGVGKTTMAAATALASAESGTKTLVVSTDPAHSLSDAFETDISPRPVQIREDVPLYAAEIDPDDAMAENGAMFGEDATTEPTGSLEPGSGAAGGDQGGLGDLLGGEGPMDMLMGGSMPGSDEAVAIQKLIEYMDDPRFDRVVVDTAPTGHTLRLLELPELMDSMIGRVIALRERFSGMFDGITGLFGDDTPEEAGADDLREFADRIERLRATLRDPALTDFRVVMVPEEMSVFESQRLVDQLAEFEIPVGTVIVNKVMEDLADVTDDVDADQFVTPNLDSCEFCQRRWDVQQDALSSAHELFRGHDIKRVPLFADEVRGERMLLTVARCLA